MAAAPPLVAAHVLQRVPAQARSRATLNRLVEAAETVLEREGPDGLMVSTIVDEAGVSVGSFYGRFDGKEELVRYVAEVALHRAMELWESGAAACAREGGGAAGTLDLLLRRLFDAFASPHLRRIRALDGAEDPAPTRLQRFRRRVTTDLKEAMAQAEPGPGDAAWMGARLAVGGAERLTDTDAGELPVDPGLELSRALRVYLRLRARKAEAWEAVLAEEVEGEALATVGRESAQARPAEAEAQEMAEAQEEAPAPPAPEAPEPASPAPVDPAAGESGVSAPDVSKPAPPAKNANRDSHSGPKPEPRPKPKRQGPAPVDPFDVWG